MKKPATSSLTDKTEQQREKIDLSHLYGVQEDLSALEKSLCYKFKNIDLLKEALTHSSSVSYLNKHSANKNYSSNERLEFLGDSILGMIISSAIWKKSKHFNEGQMSRIRASLVQESSLVTLAHSFSLENWIVKAPSRVKDSLPKSVLADCFEAIIAAIYLDSNFETISEIVLKWFHADMNNDLALLDRDHKTKLQEKTQELYQKAPYYKTTCENGPDHAKSFEVKAFLFDKEIGVGVGKSKKKAEQQAALYALNAKNFNNFNPENKVSKI